MGLDIETTALEPYNGEIRLIQVSTGDRNLVFDMFLLGEARSKHVYQAIRDHNGVVVGQNLKFEVKWFWYKQKIELYPIFDTFQASSLLENGHKEQKHNLYAVWDRYLKRQPQTPDLGSSNWSQIPLTKDQYDYAAEDTVTMHELRDVLKKLLADKGLNKVALIEFGAIQPVAEIELNGFRLDKDMWLEVARNNQIEYDRLKRELVKELPHPAKQISLFGEADTGVDLESPKQILASLRQLTPPIRQRVQIEGTETYQWMPLQDTMEMTLVNLQNSHPAIDKLLQYREKSMQLKTFGFDYVDSINPKTGRIHTSYHPFTGAGRYSSRNPNLQQLPRLKIFRDCWRPGEGKVLVICDYSGIEMRVACEISGDPELNRIFNEDLDVHKSTASFVSGKPYEKITKEDKQQAKAVNFGFIFGMGHKKFVYYAKANYGVTFSEDSARKLRNKFFDNYSYLQKWHRFSIEQFKTMGMVRTLSGRLRYLDPDAYSDVLNTPVQGTAADGLKTSLRLVLFALRKYNGAAKIVHHVHDEIIVECDDKPELIEAVKKDLEGGMIQGMSTLIKRTKIKAEPSHGASWADK
jgi:DNA polymerase I-like protein with 3'-5' exonuclease and polymerase domains